MKIAAWVIVLTLVAIIGVRTRVATMLGNQIRALSDKLIVSVLQLTSGFEAELQTQGNQGGQ